MQAIITTLLQLEASLPSLLLASLLDPNQAAQVSGILAFLAGVVSLAVPLIGELGDIADGAVTAGSLISAYLGTASAQEAINSSSPGQMSGAQVQALVSTLNSDVINPLKDLQAEIPDSRLNKMVFTLQEVDTYAIVPVNDEVINSDPYLWLPPTYPVGYYTDYSTIASVQFNVSFYTMN